MHTCRNTDIQTTINTHRTHKTGADNTQHRNAYTHENEKRTAYTHTYTQTNRKTEHDTGREDLTTECMNHTQPHQKDDRQSNITQ